MRLHQLPAISLIIPCYNESTRLAQMWEGITLFISTWPATSEFIIIDDGSTDDTAKLILQNDLYKKLVEDKRITFFQQKNSGKGGALANGIAIAKHTYILTLDTDMSTMPTELVKWVHINKNLFDNTSVYIADRTLPSSKLNLISSRRASGKLFNTIVRQLTGLKIEDTQCGFKLYPTKIAQPIFATLFTKGWAHDVEILLRLQQQNIAIVPMPIVWDEMDASKINLFKDGIKMLWQVLRITLKYKLVRKFTILF
jgi:dolichyl-phosphate beta-glucosyltransferase